MLLKEYPYVCSLHMPSGSSGRVGAKKSIGWGFSWSVPGSLRWRVLFGSRKSVIWIQEEVEGVRDSTQVRLEFKACWWPLLWQWVGPELEPDVNHCFSWGMLEVTALGWGTGTEAWYGTSGVLGQLGIPDKAPDTFQSATSALALGESKSVCVPLRAVSIS